MFEWRIMKHTKLQAACMLSCLVISTSWATNGTFNHGVGQKAQGMGGAGIAFPQDSLAAGTNPAGMVMVGDRMDAALTIFRPVRDAKRTGSLISAFDGNFDGNDEELFPMPEFGYNKMINETTSFGVSVFGNGGMNTSYSDGISMFNGVSEFPTFTGMNLMQLYIVPTVAWKLNDNHSFGIGINLVGQALEIEGLQNFDRPGVSKYPGKVTDNGMDYSYGAGLRLGWIGKINDWLSLGATYQTKVSMSNFDDYKGMLAEGGGFDIPETYGAGLVITAIPKLTIAFDVVQINFSDTNSMGNGGPSTNTDWLPLGSSNGAGFGWDDQTVYKLGLAYQLNPDWVVRTGYNHGDSPINEKETLLNTLAPATVEDHLTLGATWRIDEESELTFHYMHAFENEIKGRSSSLVPFPPGIETGETDIKMYQDTFGVGYSWIF